MTLAYLAQRKIHLLRDADSPAEELESQYVEEVRRRSASIERKSAWKTQGTGARFMGAAAMWDDSAGRVDPVSFTCLARGRKPGEILYAVWTGAVGALLAYDVATREETRLVHGTNAPTSGIATSDDHTVLALVRPQKNGSQNLAVMRDDGGDDALVTDGDTIDDSPSWVPVDAKAAAAGAEVKRHQLVFASRGIGRTPDGQMGGFGPTEINLLDAEHGDLKTLVRDEAFDYLEPRMLADGTLYAMRRPYRAGNEAPSAGHVLKDGLLAPLRLGYAGFRYLDYFSQKYAGKPLTTSGDVKGRNLDARRLLERQNIARAGRSDADEEEASRAPQDWVLVRRRPRAEDEVVATGVAAYDVDRRGLVHTTDGSSIERIEPNDRRRTLVKARFVSAIVPIASV
jgi:hypothetical protein